MSSALRDVTNAPGAKGLRRNGAFIALAMVLTLFAVMGTTHTDVVSVPSDSGDTMAGQSKATPAATAIVSETQPSNNGSVAVAQSTAGVAESTNSGRSGRHFAVGGQGLLMAMAASGVGLLLAVVAAFVSAATVLRRKLFTKPHAYRPIGQ